MTLRQYAPPIGKSVRMRNFDDYTSRGIHVWAWLRVHSINSDGATIQVLNGDTPTGETLTIPLSTINPPIGWEPRYTIYCKPEIGPKVIREWFARGIVVRANHLIGDGSGSAFQPIDNAGIPHWKYPEVTDVIDAADCAKLFRVITVERQDVYDAYRVPDADCAWCHGSGRDSLARVNATRTNAAMQPCDAQTLDSLRQRDGWDEIGQTFDCTCTRGGFRLLGRTRRAKLIREWRKDGWETHYNNYGVHGYWERVRDTILHDWAD